MTFTSTITKDAIAKMPREKFSGRIVIVNTLNELENAISYLSSLKEIGFDTETRPNYFKTYSRHKTALVQLSGNDTCFLIRLNKFMKVPVALKSLLNDEHVKKIGLSLNDDFQGLNNLVTLAPANVIDLQEYVVPFGIEEMSLQKIYAILFGKKIAKRIRLSNWEAETLTEAQIQYAALDAWSCLRIYQFLEQSR